VSRHGRRMLLGPAARRALLGAVLLVAAAVLLAPVGRGVTVEIVAGGPDGSIPVHLYIPDASAEDAGPVSAGPGVVVAHGFAGSARLMHSWSLALARAGFTVAAPDLPGHGRNASRMPASGASRDLPRGTVTLGAAVDAALAQLVDLPGADPARVALLGHSIGSGAVLDLGIARPDVVRAVVAVAPTDAALDTRLPRDLLLLVGANDSRFVANAESLLERAGGERGAAGDGDARRLVIVPRVEHVSILFSRTAHDESIVWLSSALDHTPAGPAPRGPLAGWVLLAAGLLVLWQAVGQSATTPAPAPRRRRGGWLALPVGGIAATASLVILVRAVDVSAALGMLVAGEVGLWFLMTGAVWLRFGIRPAAPDVRDVGWAVLAAAALVTLGATSALAWAPWWLPGVRVGPAVLLTLCLLPFSIAAASALHGNHGRTASGIWVANSVAVVATLGVAAIVIPGLGFLLLILPLLPVMLAVTSVIAVGIDRPWATGTAGALFVGWLLASIFPLA